MRPRNCCKSCWLTTPICWPVTRCAPRSRAVGCSSRARRVFPARREGSAVGQWTTSSSTKTGTPTLVEVKRSSDTRLRREVIGQMLEYAANVASYWSPSTVRGLFDERCQREGLDPDVELRRFLGLAGDVRDGDDMTVQAFDDFWRRSSDSLASRRLRLVFVADVIPPELQRIIEFLNETMTRVEVLAVEVKQFVGAGRQTLVPRVIGHTTAADDVKRTATTGRPPHRDWTREQFLASTEEVGGLRRSHGCSIPLIGPRATVEQYPLGTASTDRCTLWLTPNSTWASPSMRAGPRRFSSPSWLASLRSTRRQHVWTGVVV